MEASASRRNLLLAILAFAVIAGAILVIVVARRGGEAPDPVAGGGDFESALQAVELIPTVNIPSANPLDRVTTNPIKAANPFRDAGSNNPFR